MVRRAVFLLALVTLEVFYNLSAGRWAFLFAPLITLQIAAFIGLLFGSRSGLVWGASAGLIEELYFSGVGQGIGLTPFVYMWTGYLSGKIFYSRADLTSPAIGAFVTCAILAFGLISGALLEFMYGYPPPILWFRPSWSRLFVFLAQIVAAPAILHFLAKVLALRLPRTARQ